MQKTILLVDDQLDVRRILARMLGSLGYAVIVASSGAEALELDRTHTDTIHVLLTDLEMPGMDGRELASALQRRRPGMGVLYLSGHIDDLDDNARRNPQHRDFLMKPVTLQELSSSIARLIEGMPTA